MSDYDKIRDLDLSTLERPVEENMTEPEDQGQMETDASGKEEETGPKEMMEPQGKHYYVDAEFEDRDLLSFVVAHTYRRPYMIIITILGIISPIYAISVGRGNPFFSVVCLLIFLVYFPAATFMRGKNFKAMNPVYAETYHYMFDEWGLHLKIRDDAVDVEWDRVIKMVFLRRIIVLYTGKINAFLVPYASMSDRKEITEFIKAKGKC